MVDLLSRSFFNLALQIIMLALIVFGIKLAKDKAFRKHGRIMAVVVILNGISILIVMGPSFMTLKGALIRELFTVGAAVTFVHAVLGSLAEALGIALVIRKFGNVKMWMRIVTDVWIVALIFGIIFYVYYYV